MTDVTAPVVGNWRSGMRQHALSRQLAAEACAPLPTNQAARSAPAAGPAGVDQPDLGAVPLQLVSEHGGILHLWAVGSGQQQI